jgi:membrane-associated phospholipid phosphatase
MASYETVFWASLGGMEMLANFGESPACKSHSFGRWSEACVCCRSEVTERQWTIVMSRPRAVKLGAVSAVASASFAATAWATATRTSAHFDRAAAPRIALRPRSRRRRVAESLSPIGKWYSVVSAAFLGGVVVARVSDRPIAGATIAASATSALLAKVFDRTLPQPPVPANHRHKPRKAVFPSGHAMVGTAVSMTAAYVMSRERLVKPAAIFPAAIAFSLGNPAAKLAVRKHWPSDVAGGLTAGVAVAAACCAVYELLRD